MKISSIIIFLLFACDLAAQALFYEDEFKGGATASGGSPGAYTTFTPSDFEIFIPDGSTIRKAYLFAGRHGGADDTEIDLNGIVYTFDASNQVSADFYSIYTSGSNSGVHAIDITSDIDPAVSDYTLEVLDTYFGPLDIYLDFYLFVTYDNPALDSTFVSIYINEQDFDDSESDPVWEINLPQPMDTTCVDIGIAYMTGYACFMSDGEEAYINDISIGTWGGNEDNSGDCGGPLGSFTYYDGDLIGLMDDNEDNIVNETDVVATINDYITVGSSYLELDFTYAAGGGAESSNAVWLAAIIYGEGAEIVDSLVTAGDDALICEGDTIQIFATGTGDFEWTPAESLSDAFVAGPYAFPSSTTTYIVGVDNGCFADYDSLTVFVDEFEINLEDEIELCVGENIHIGIDPEEGIEYSWSPVIFLDNVNISDPLTTTTENITYTLTAVNENNCLSEDAVDILINSAHVIAGNDTIILSGGTAVIFATGDGVVYQWLPVDYLDCADCAITSASPPVTTTYLVMITDKDGCIDYDSVTINVDTECSHLIHFPNAFSPNGDHINDLFYAITYLSAVENPHLSIYNRWGELIFDTNDISNTWNGEFNGKLMPAGNYPYIFTFNCFGDPQKLTGSIMLVR